MKFDILILAAGLGSRLKSATSSRPKAMVEYKSKKLIELQISRINKNLIGKVIVVTGYKEAMLKEFLKKRFPKINFFFLRNRNFTKNSSGQSFFYAYKYLSTNSYVHLNCDCIYSKEHMIKLLQSNATNLISVRSDIQLSDKMENVEVENSKILNMTLKNNPNCKYKAYGVAKISKYEMLRNIKLYKSLSNDEKLKINYFSLIRKNISLGINYKILNSSKHHLHEINTQKDKKICTVKN